MKCSISPNGAFGEDGENENTTLRDREPLFSIFPGMKPLCTLVPFVVDDLSQHGDRC
jgi:hypothetical protein